MLSALLSHASAAASTIATAAAASSSSDIVPYPFIADGAPVLAAGVGLAGWTMVIEAWSAGNARSRRRRCSCLQQHPLTHSLARRIFVPSAPPRSCVCVCVCVYRLFAERLPAVLNNDRMGKRFDPKKQSKEEFNKQMPVKARWVSRWEEEQQQQQ